MDYDSQLNKAFEQAVHLPLTPDSKYILMSDCHRGNGTPTDDFLKNQNLFFTAMQYYYKAGHTYIELGDGDELWKAAACHKLLAFTVTPFGSCQNFIKKTAFICSMAIMTL